MRKQLSSLQARLLFALAVVLLILGATLWAGLRWSTEREASQDLDRRLMQTAVLLQITLRERVAAAKGTEPQWRAPQSAGEAAWQVPPSFEVVTRGEQVIIRSPNFPRPLGDAAPGFESRTVQGHDWRVFTQADEARGVTYRVAMSWTVAEARQGELQYRFAQPLLWAAPVFLLAALVAVRQSLAPLRRLERAVARQDAANPGPLDIERDRVPRELRALVARLDRLLEQVGGVLVRQRAFVAAAGHELRTPLAGLKSQLDVARRSRETSQRERALTQAGRSIARMTALIEQLLLLARSDGRAPPAPQAEIELVALVDDVVTEYQGKARRAGLRLTLTSAPSSIRLKGNATLLESMVANLLENALRFSPQGSEVCVLLAASTHRVELRVRDQGPGIPEPEREHVFDPFYRGNGEPRFGSGLGLTIVQAVVRLHRGRVALEKAPGGGNDAVVELPLVADPQEFPRR
jgi:signal transduction histidine kinase